jgi:hypothetical protein
MTVTEAIREIQWEPEDEVENVTDPSRSSFNRSVVIPINARLPD